MVTKYVAEKFDETKVNPSMTISEVILAQFGLDIDNGPYDVTEMYMPQEEQDKMEEWLLKNAKEFKRIPIALRKKEMSWVVLGFFPSSVYKEENGCI